MYKNMKKYWKWILAVVALLLVGLLIWFLIDYYSIPRLPDSEKKKIEEIYYERLIPLPSKPWLYPLVWYDENGGVEEEFVWRYIGTYGDCYAFLDIADNLSDVDGLTPMINPYPIHGFDREVYYPIEVNVVLYHIPGEILVKGEYRDYATQVAYLEELKSEYNREEWITDEQLEQLARDIEAISTAN